MKSLFGSLVVAVVSSGYAIAADMPVKSRPVAAPAYSWTGLYIGGNVGGGIGPTEWTYFQNPSFPPTVVGYDPGSGIASGFLGGVQLGANYQMGRLVLGVEGDWVWTSLKGSVPCASNPQCSNDPIVFRSDIDRIATLAGRIGLTAGDALIYAKGGRAWAHQKFNVSCVFGTCQVPVVGFNVGSTDTRTGWMFGAGIEYTVDNNWSAKLEYNFLDFGTDTIHFPAGNVAGPSLNGFSTDVRQQLHIIKLGANYRFNFGSLANY